jgi:excisionase family DNA binding protein
MTAVGYTVGDAARRLDCSEPTIRRLIERGALEQVDRARPLLVTAESVDREVMAKLQRMGVGAVRDPDSSRLQDRIRELEAEVSRLKGGMDDLVAANAAMLDTYRRLSTGGIPNN